MPEALRHKDFMRRPFCPAIGAAPSIAFAVF